MHACIEVDAVTFNICLVSCVYLVQSVLNTDCITHETVLLRRLLQTGREMQPPVSLIWRMVLLPGVSQNAPGAAMEESLSYAKMKHQLDSKFKFIQITAACKCAVHICLCRVCVSLPAGTSGPAGNSRTGSARADGDSLKGVWTRETTVVFYLTIVISKLSNTSPQIT